MIKKYNHKDYKLIKQWHEAQGQVAPPNEALSSNGWIMDGRVAGWLYLTDANMAIVDLIIANPSTLPSQRRQSLKALCGFIIDYAIALGYTNIIAATSHPNIAKLANEFGFKEHEKKIFILSETSTAFANEEADSMVKKAYT